MTNAEHKIVAEIEDTLREEVAAWRVIHQIEASNRKQPKALVLDESGVPSGEEVAYKFTGSVHKLKKYVRYLRNKIDDLFIELRQVDITDVLDGKWDKLKQKIDDKWAERAEQAFDIVGHDVEQCEDEAAEPFDVRAASIPGFKPGAMQVLTQDPSSWNGLAWIDAVRCEPIDPLDEQ